MEEQETSPLDVMAEAAAGAARAAGRAQARRPARRRPTACRLAAGWRGGGGSAAAAAPSGPRPVAPAPNVKGGVKGGVTRREEARRGVKGRDEV